MIANYERRAMGASAWDYVTPYQGSVQTTLAALHDEVFQELYGDGEEYESLEAVYADEEFMGEEGTHSILDIDRIVETSEPPRNLHVADYGTIRPLPPVRLIHYFGTNRPTVDQYNDTMARSYEAMETSRPGEESTTLLGELRMCWTGFYVLLYADCQPTHVGFFGSSGD
ncbi:hypothetical protein HEP85_13195 [Streptomyces sp. RPA4-2]|uniref:hypothetical protein n=1 Tax=Streptomyces sp. RPA4-2 TaxID=2721244 RepID=UPI002001DC81|nr:hypothetical protein [Streptomyces sp. RPA4-2]